MSGALMGMVAGVPDEILGKLSESIIFQVASDFSNIDFEPALEVVNGKLQFKDLQTIGVTNIASAMTTLINKMGFYYKITAPSEPAGQNYVLKDFCMKLTAGSGGEYRSIFGEVRSDNSGTPGSVLNTTNSVSVNNTYTFCTFNPTITITLNAGDSIWVGCYDSALDAIVHCFQSVTQPTDCDTNKQSEIVGNLFVRTEASSWGESFGKYLENGSIDHPLVRLDTVPLRAEFSSIHNINSIISWEEVKNFNLVVPTNSSANISVKDENDVNLFTDIADPQSLSSIDISLYKTIKIAGIFERTNTDVTPTIDAFELSYYLNKCVGVDWTSTIGKLSYEDNLTAHQANTHEDIQGSGYVCALVNSYGATTAWCVEIDGERRTINNQYGGTFFILWRFNSSCKITCSREPTQTVFSVIILD